jgi:hypothetical protein
MPAPLPRRRIASPSCTQTSQVGAERLGQPASSAIFSSRATVRTQPPRRRVKPR